ncbi:hypothetical protein [Streptomyces niphimycinicus]|uniref:hypothetical protein n=1 Tax=Streptomyces niphimycinicus TaxID=2842201 RepID=UPI00209B506A|nr:hypothetical protein [Streptomyces niphimycinicus]
MLRTIPLEAGTEPLPLLREIGTAEPAAAGADQGGDLFAGLSDEELHARLTEEIVGQIAGEMRLPVASFDVRRSLVEAGPRLGDDNGHPQAAGEAVRPQAACHAAVAPADGGGDQRTRRGVAVGAMTHRTPNCPLSGRRGGSFSRVPE